MEPKKIRSRADQETRGESYARAGPGGLTASDAAPPAVSEAYVHETYEREAYVRGLYRRAAAESARWAADPAYRAEVSEVRAAMDGPRPW
ncbi:hypothetical protein [Streptomyces fradiae]|uniref:hypothetical protein n=1 Tax=Streptomyces fradiae TaxID=1906 RepID=UPI0029428730|nr:hypothetical protein [Streptomyces fradiae]WOI62541.1 hypothetical protein RYQ63_23050 [Streptomyces fradiae]